MRACLTKPLHPLQAIVLRITPDCTVRAMPQTVNGDTGANDCSFGEVGRQAIRGGNWVAVVADFPSPSLYVRAHCPACAGNYAHHVPEPADLDRPAGHLCCSRAVWTSSCGIGDDIMSADCRGLQPKKPLATLRHSETNCCAQIINPATQTVHGVVNTTADNPTTVVWAPTKNAGVTLDANAAGFAPYTGPGPAPSQASGPASQAASPASAPAPAPNAAGAAHAMPSFALPVVAGVALLLSAVM